MTIQPIDNHQEWS